MNFRIIAALLFLALIIIESSLTKNILESHRHVAGLQLTQQKYLFDATGGIIANNVYSLSMEETLHQWASASIHSPSYYFQGIKLQSILKSYTPIFGYSISLTRPGDDSFVITSTETMSKEAWLKRQGVEGNYQEVFDGRDQVHYALDEEGIIETLLIIYNLNLDGSRISITISLPSSLYSLEERNALTLIDKNGNIVYSSDERLKEASFEENLLDIKQGHLFEISGYLNIAASLPFSDYELVITSLERVNLLAYLLIALSIACFLPLMIRGIRMASENMYRPIEQAISMLSEDREDTPEDEFAFILENCQKINKLNIELAEANRAHSMLKEQQKYRAFIRGVATEVLPNDSCSWFTLSIASLEEDNADSDVIFSKLDNITREIEHLHSIRITKNMNVFIYKNDSQEESYDLMLSTLQALIFHMEGSEDLRFSITDSGYGYDSIKDLFLKATEILQYRYRIRSKFILTKEDLPKDKVMMNYPITDERMLINAVLTDNEEALTIFDGIMENNYNKQLSSAEMARFQYAIIGTVNRIFQELKTSPEEILGYCVDFESLYKEKDPQTIEKELRRILEDLIAALKTRSMEEDDQLIGKMKEYINCNYNKNIMLIDLSEKFNLTPKYCSTLFRKLSNDTFKNYLNQLRIEKACQIMEENPYIKINELSEMVGFQSSNTFIRAFSRLMGTTPGTYAENLLLKR